MNGIPSDSIMTPVLQYGFAGFAAILLAIIVWLIQQLIKLIRENNDVIAHNSQVIQKLLANQETFEKSMNDLLKLTRSTHELILTGRPASRD